jgi:hypothetical protein
VSKAAAKRKLAELIGAFSEARSAYVEAHDAAQRTTTPADSKEVADEAARRYRATWEIALQLLRAAVKSEAGSPIAGEVALFIADQMDNVITGNRWEELKQLTRLGPPSADVRLRAAQEALSAYVAAARSGLILAEANPIAIVAEAYDIEHDTAQQWCRDHPIDVDRLYPLIGWEGKCAAIALHMAQFGKWYRQQPRHGTGADALRRKEARRRTPPGA